MDDAITWRISRPFPSTGVLGSSSRIGTIPLLKDLVAAVVENEHEHEHTEKVVTEDEVVAIDNPANSTLTRGQHERYLKLQADTNKSRWTLQQRREYRTLKTLVETEQQVYRQARQEYVLQNLERFMAGFPSSEFATWHSRRTHAYIDQWKAKGLPLKFGKVRQIISLSQHDTMVWIPGEMFESRMVKGNQDSPPSCDLQGTLPPWKQPTAPHFLKEDNNVIELAKKFNAVTIVSAEVLEHVLTLDSWKIPLWNRADGIRILEEPLPQPTIPRRCLEKGIEASIQNDAWVYTLLTMKCSNKPIHVLVRGHHPCPRVHLEYFADRGSEELSSHDMACWILDSLMEPKGSIHLVRVDVRDWTIQSRQSVSVAHALANGNGVLTPWNRLFSLFGALESMPTDGDYLLRCRDLSVTLHRVDESNTEIDLALELEDADVVSMSPTALLSCARPWRWAYTDRSLDTFPIKKS